MIKKYEFNNNSWMLLRYFIPPFNFCNMKSKQYKADIVFNQIAEILSKSKA